MRRGSAASRVRPQGRVHPRNRQGPLRVVGRSHGAHRQGRQHLGHRQGLGHGRQVQSGGPRHVGLRPAQGIRRRGPKPWEHPNPPLPPIDGLFRQPTDVAWDSDGNIYISDGYVNSRVAKYRQERRLGEVLGRAGRRAGPVSPAARHRASTATTMSTSATAPTAASRSSTPTASFCACSRLTCRRSGTRAVYGPTPTGDRSRR